MKNYQQLTLEQRYQISALLKRGCLKRVVAALVLHIFGGKPSQIVIDEFEQFVGRNLVARTRRI